MIKNFFVACVIAIAMPALALIPNVPEASKSLGLNNNTAKSEILGGGAIVVSGEGFNTYETIRGSDTNYAAKITGGQHPHGGRLLEDTDTAWSFLSVVNVGGAQNNRSIIWSIGKKSTRGIALLYSKADRALQLAKWTTGDAIETVTSINLSDDHSQYRSILVTCSNNQYVVYVDGENRGTYDGEIAIDRAFYQIGSVNEGAFDAEKGLGILIDEIGVWNQVLTEEDARLIAAAFPVWPGILEKDVEEREFRLSTIKAAEIQEKEIIELTMTEQNPTIIVDTTFSDITTIKPTFSGILTIKKAQDGISDSAFGEMLAKFFVNGLQLTNLASESNVIKVKANGMLVVEAGEEVTCNVGDGENYTLKGIEGSGMLVKKGRGTLRVSGQPAIDNTTIKIVDGEFSLDSGAGVSITNATFIIDANGDLTSTGGMTGKGTITFESASDKDVFADRDIWGGPSIVKKGSGRINLKCSSQNAGTNGSSENKPFETVEIDAGTLALSSTWAKSIKELIGAGTLEQAGGGVMTISKIAPETSLKVTSGALNNECAVGNGSITLAGLEIAGGATYTMKPAIDHLNLTNSFYLEGDAHKNWYVTLGDGALIATNPENPMTLAGLEFGKSVKIGKDQSVGSVLANVVKPLNMPDSVTSEDERFAKIPYTLKCQTGSIVIARTFTAELETIPGKDLNAAKYRIKVTELPKGVESGDIRVRITTPYSSALANVKRSGDEWYAELNPAVMNEAKGEAYQIKVEIGVNDNNKFVPIESYGEISLNVRPEVKNGAWIDEASHDRWRTGTWNTEGEYITISEGYVQVEGEKVSFVPGNINKEAATKLHFEVKFGEAMKLKILNALSDEEMFAGVALEEAEDGSIGYAAWNPTSKEYVSVISSDKKPIDVSASHLVEVTLAKNGIAYSIDGAALVTKDEKASSIFTLPKNTSIQIAEIDFEGMGAVKSMTADEYSTKLAAYDGVEYDTIEKAIIAAGDASRVEIEQLWDASWVPTPDLKDKVIVFIGDHKVSPDTTSGILAENDMVLRPNADGSYSVISKFLTVTIPDPETLPGSEYVYVESITTDSIHLRWTYDYQSKTPAVAQAKVVYEDDVTIEFSSNLEVKKDSFVHRTTLEWLKSITLKKVRYNTTLASEDIPMIESQSIEGLAAFASLGVDRSKAKMVADKSASINILEFSTNAEGATFQVALVDSEGNDISQLVTEQIGDMVEFSTDLQNWVKVGAENVKVITNDDGVQVMFAQQEGATSGFYKIVIPAE